MRETRVHDNAIIERVYNLCALHLYENGHFPVIMCARINGCFSAFGTRMRCANSARISDDAARIIIEELKERNIWPRCAARNVHEASGARACDKV